MNKNILFKKSISFLVFCLILFAAVFPIVSAITTCSIRDETKNQALRTNQSIDITIYGSHYMKENAPLNFTNGLYTEFIYHGNGSIPLNVSFSLTTKSTQSISVHQIIGENFLLPAEATGMAAISYLNFGIGFFSYTFFIDGCGEFSDIHYEKTAVGICFGYNAFVIFQHYNTG
jgi:hypothetical protein